MRYCKDKEIDRYVHQLMGKGWCFWHGTKHGRIRSPSGKTLTVPSTPSDRRAARNFIAEVRRITRAQCLAQSFNIK
jgi:hypothetical protein